MYELKLEVWLEEREIEKYTGREMVKICAHPATQKPDSF